jgi:hypothetical protein
VADVEAPRIPKIVPRSGSRKATGTGKAKKNTANRNRET